MLSKSNAVRSSTEPRDSVAVNVDTTSGGHTHSSSSVLDSEGANVRVALAVALGTSSCSWRSSLEASYISIKSRAGPPDGPLDGPLDAITSSTSSCTSVVCADGVVDGVAEGSAEIISLAEPDNVVDAFCGHVAVGHLQIASDNARS